MKTTNANRMQEIGTIMEMFGLKHSEAQQIYDSSGQDLNIAIQEGVDRQSAGRHQQRKEVARSVRNEEAKGGIAKMTNIQFDNLKKIKERKMAEQAKRAQQQKRMQERVKENYDRQYVNRMDFKADKPLNYKKKTANGQKQQTAKHFIPTFQAYLGKPSQLAFYSDPSEVFEQHWSSSKLIMLHLLNLSDMKITARDSYNDDFQRDLILNFLKEVYLNSKFTDIFNREFINYGIDPKHYDFNSNHQMIEFFNPKRDIFSLLILKYNEKDRRVDVKARLNIFEFIDPRDLQGFQKRVSDKMRDAAKSKAEDRHIDPVAIVESRKIEEDRRLRLMQEQEYMQMKEKYEGKKESATDELRKLAMKEIVEDKARERQEGKKELAKYKAEELKDAIQFKLRFPSGKQLLLHLPKGEKVEYIFAWIECLQDPDLGFENNLLRSFDLLQPLSSLSLASHKDKALGSVFTDSSAEVLMVRQN